VSASADYATANPGEPYRSLFLNLFGKKLGTHTHN
jgi:hypothetical protein